MKIGFIKTHELARLPERNNKQRFTGDSGYDVYSVEDVIIPAKSSNVVPIGLDVAYIEAGYWIRVESRSGLFFKHGISIFNGIIDNSFRGGLKISLLNNSIQDYGVKSGDRIAQLVMYNLIEPDIRWMDAKVETVRGEKGFGSSGR
jgi:deoxyuridine 5'-triphosphate nucleotidohydrolase